MRRILLLCRLHKLCNMHYGIMQCMRGFLSPCHWKREDTRQFGVLSVRRRTLGCRRMSASTCCLTQRSLWPCQSGNLLHLHGPCSKVAEHSGAKGRPALHLPLAEPLPWGYLGWKSFLRPLKFYKKHSRTRSLLVDRRKRGKVLEVSSEALQSKCS